jgi:hypothetical protein
LRHPGGLFFRGFLLAEQKKATQGAGAEPPAISCSISPKAIRQNYYAKKTAGMFPCQPFFS